MAAAVVVDFSWGFWKAILGHCLNRRFFVGAEDVSFVETEDMFFVSTEDMSFVSTEDMSSVVTEDLSFVSTEEMYFVETQDMSCVSTEDMSFVETEDIVFFGAILGPVRRLIVVVFCRGVLNLCVGIVVVFSRGWLPRTVETHCC